MSNKPIQCTVCWRYRGETRGGLRNHQRQAGCSNILRARNASRTKKDNLGRSLSDEIERQPSPDLSIHPTNFPEISLPKRARVSLEEVPDEGDSPPQLSRSQFTSVDFDGAGAVASDVEKKESVFQQYKQEKEIRGEEAWSPFKSHAEWQLARWLMLSGISQGDIDSFAKLPIIQTNLQPSFKDKRTFFQKIDSLPIVRGGWICKELELVGNIKQKAADGTETLMSEQLELWMRNPLDCIKELMEDPRFKDHMRYSPEKMFTDEKMHVRAIDEMWTADWWWATQKLLPAGATIAPIILASDKTQLSAFSGDKSAWPVYLTLGNIDASVRRKPSEQASILIGYIPVSKLECFTKADRSLEGNRLFHDCMGILLESLVEAGDPTKGGVKMLCSDGQMRIVYPILAAYVADFPEQCLVAGCQERRCPKCIVDGKELGDPLHSVLRDPDKTLRALRLAAEGDKDTAHKLGLRKITPFWANLPLCNIFHCITPDILHQLHKGVFKDHLVKWSTEAVACDSNDAREKEVDTRFQSMPRHQSLRHFKKGISLITQWTGNEYKNMEKIFLGVITGAVVSRDVVICVRAVLDFIEYAQFNLHTDESLSQMDQALRTFHAHKHAAFVETEIRKHFNIPKVHAMNHYVPMIQSLGVAPGYNTEWSERLHIDFAKLAYRASNKRDYIKQMTRWLDRREKVLWFTRFLDWVVETDDIDWIGIQEDESNEEGVVNRDSVGEEEKEVQTRADLQYGESTYNMAKHPPLPNVDIGALESDYGCDTFVYAMERFLREHKLLKLDYWDATPAKYQLYKRIRIVLPSTPIMDICRTTAAQPAAVSGKTQRKLVPAQVDTVLARKELPGSRSEGLNVLGPKGLHVAQVRAIFELPEELGTFPHPLAYVEWFTPLQKLDEDTLMYRVERSERNNTRSASIIPVTYISRSCHLIPFSGKRANSMWTSESVLNECKSFHLNSYLRPIDFVLLRTQNPNTQE